MYIVNPLVTRGVTRGLTPKKALQGGQVGTGGVVFNIALFPNGINALKISISVASLLNRFVLKVLLHLYQLELPGGNYYE